MTLHELANRLDKEGISADYYSLEGGWPNDKLCLDKTYSGWDVYYCERGLRYDVHHFILEEEACEYMYGRLRRMMKYI